MSNTRFLNIRSSIGATFIVTVFVMMTANNALFKHILAIYPPSLKNIPFVASLFMFFGILTLLFFLLLSIGRISRWLIALLILIAAPSAYYMDHYGVLMDVVMIDNIVHTDTKEAAGLLNFGIVSQTCFLGLLPAWLVVKYWPSTASIKHEIFNRLKLAFLLVILLITIVLPFSAGYASFIREHKIARFYANPTYPVYSVVKYATQQLLADSPIAIKRIAEDAQLIGPASKNELVILVIGETARADRFSLNGYQRETNPLLTQENVISFSHVSACGTSTGVSVPCMFSALSRKDYDKRKALMQENALDVLADNRIDILWRDNNSDSKGVATRVQYENYKTPTLNPVCEGECRDVGMLSGLDDYIAKRKGKDLMIVLHQMGNHGPEYYRRYPKAFARFQPTCMTGELQNCSKEEIDNSYDNAILYTDYFLSEVIQFLKKYDGDYETAMLYVSDHGESLGENGVYLHAAPYLVAPKEQTHIPAILWLGEHFDYKREQVIPYKDYALSHDDLFCTLLVAYELDSHMCAAKEQLLMENLDIQASLNRKGKQHHTVRKPAIDS